MSTPTPVRIRAWDDPIWRGISLHVFRDQLGENKVLQFQDDPGDEEDLSWFAFEDRHESASLGTPVFRLEPPAAQLLMDELWRAGIRPSEESRHTAAEGALAATRTHLEDMRHIAFGGLKLGKP